MKLTTAHVSVLQAMERGEYYAFRHWGKTVITQEMVFPRKGEPLGIKQCSDMEIAGLITSGAQKRYRTGVEIPLLITEAGKKLVARSSEEADNAK